MGKSGADKTEIPTPTVEEMPRPIYLKPGARKAAGRVINDAGIGDRNDEAGYLVNVSPEAPQLSPDSVDQEFSSEEDPGLSVSWRHLGLVVVNIDEHFLLSYPESITFGTRFTHISQNTLI